MIKVKQQAASCAHAVNLIIIRVDEIEHSDWLRVTGRTLLSHNVPVERQFTS